MYPSEQHLNYKYIFNQIILKINEPSIKAWEMSSLSPKASLSLCYSIIIFPDLPFFVLKYRTERSQGSHFALILVRLLAFQVLVALTIEGFPTITSIHTCISTANVHLQMYSCIFWSVVLHILSIPTNIKMVGYTEHDQHDWETLLKAEWVSQIPATSAIWNMHCSCSIQEDPEIQTF